MDFDHEDPFCKNTCAMLLVSGDNIDASEFTELLRLEPTEIAKAGDCTGWRISSEYSVQSTNLETHINWVLDQIADKRLVIEALKQRNCQVDIYCTWQGHESANDAGPILMPATTRRVAESNLNLIFAFRR